VDRFKEQLGERVTDVRTTDRLTDSVARLVDPEGTLNQEMQRVYRLMDRDYEVPKKVLELNPRHPVLAKLNQMPTDDGLSALVIEQIYDSALLIEGLHPDPASMLPRIQELMEKALK
jgi:molecular chaperone HtpG